MAGIKNASKYVSEMTVYSEDASLYIYIDQSINIPYNGVETDEYIPLASMIDIEYIITDPQASEQAIEGGEYRDGDWYITHYGYRENINGDVVPVLYRSDYYDDEENLNIDTGEAFFYEGTFTYNGETYDKWRKIEFGSDNDVGWPDSGEAERFILTKVIVE